MRDEGPAPQSKHDMLWLKLGGRRRVARSHMQTYPDFALTNRIQLARRGLVDQVEQLSKKKVAVEIVSKVEKKVRMQCHKIDG